MITSQTFSRARRITTLAAIAVAAPLLLAGCGNGLSASSSCATYLKASESDEVSLVTSLFHKVHPLQPASGPAAANAVFNVGYECQQVPAEAVGNLGDFQP
jgi:hypothetical protein